MTPEAALTHNSTIYAGAEPAWGRVDKPALPRQAFADQGEASQKSTWGYPHHWVQGGQTKDANGVWTDGTLYLHTGGWQAAINAANGARSGQKASQAVIDHLEAHRSAVERHRQQQAMEVLDYQLQHSSMVTGIWGIEPLWMAEALQRVVVPTAHEEPQAEDMLSRQAYLKVGDTAVLRLAGPMQKGQSFFLALLGGTSTIAVRRALYQAAADETVGQIMLSIDSPGGQVAGTAELAQAVREVSYQKPVMAYIEDLGASAAYWVASQAQTISTNALAEVGSIGVMVAVEDMSARAEQMGIKVHVVSSGPDKGVGVPGTPLLPPHLQAIQERVDALAQHFFAAVAEGRGLTKTQLAAVTTGKVFAAQDAVTMGLTDQIQTFSEAMASLAGMRPRRRGRTYAIHALRAAMAGIVDDAERNANDAR